MLAYICFIVMWLFSSTLVPGEFIFNSFSKLCEQKVLCENTNSASVSGENGKSLALTLKRGASLITNNSERLEVTSDASGNWGIGAWHKV